VAAQCRADEQCQRPQTPILVADPALCAYEDHSAVVMTGVELAERKIIMGISMSGFKDTGFRLFQLQGVRRTTFRSALMISVFAITIIGLSACGSTSTGGSLQNETIGQRSSFQTDLNVVGADQVYVGRVINAASKSEDYNKVITACRKLDHDANILKNATIPNKYSSATETDLANMISANVFGAMACIEAVNINSPGVMNNAVSDFASAATAETDMAMGNMRIGNA